MYRDLWLDFDYEIVRDELIRYNGNGSNYRPESIIATSQKNRRKKATCRIVKVLLYYNMVVPK